MLFLPRSIQNKSSECFVKVGSCTVARNITINKTEPGPHLQGPFSAVREKSGYQMTTQASLAHLALEMRMFYLLQQSKNLISLMSMCVCVGGGSWCCKSTSVEISTLRTEVPPIALLHVKQWDSEPKTPRSKACSTYYFMITRISPQSHCLL